MVPVMMTIIKLVIFVSDRAFLTLVCLVDPCFQESVPFQLVGHPKGSKWSMGNAPTCSVELVLLKKVGFLMECRKLAQRLGVPGHPGHSVRDAAISLVVHWFGGVSDLLPHMNPINHMRGYVTSNMMWVTEECSSRESVGGCVRPFKLSLHCRGEVSSFVVCERGVQKPGEEGGH